MLLLIRSHLGLYDFHPTIPSNVNVRPAYRYQYSARLSFFFRNATKFISSVYVRSTRPLVSMSLVESFLVLDFPKSSWHTFCSGDYLARFLFKFVSG